MCTNVFHFTNDISTTNMFSSIDRKINSSIFGYLNFSMLGFCIIQNKLACSHLVDKKVDQFVLEPILVLVLVLSACAVTCHHIFFII